MVVNEQNFPKRNSARSNFRDQRQNIFLLVQGWNNDGDGIGERGRVYHSKTPNV
jgi:hypothetical protein